MIWNVLRSFVGTCSIATSLESARCAMAFGEMLKKKTLSIFSSSHFSLEMTYYLMSCLVARTTGFCLCSTFSARSRQLLENNFLLPPLTLLG